MVKYLGLAAVVALPLVFAGSAQAIGHHRGGGCATCGGGGGYVMAGGCPGGVCSVPYAAAPGKMAVIGNAPPGYITMAPAPAPVVTTVPVESTPVVTTAPAQPSPNSYAMVRRGLFGRRR